MTKLKNPFLSLGAHGSIGDSLTLQKRGAGTMARTKPMPTDPYTLLQAYHRWDYQDYADLWHSLTPAQKEQWNKDARPYKITGFNYWMRTKLTTLADIAGRWHLDQIIGTQTPDSSKNANHGTVYGALLTKGIIDKCLSFDGLDDYVDIGAGKFDDIEDGTVEMWIKRGTLAAARTLFTHRVDGVNRSPINMGTDYKITAYMVWQNTYPNVITDDAIPAQWTHYAFTFGSGGLKSYVNGVLQASTNPTTKGWADLGAPSAYNTLGAGLGGSDAWPGLIDEERINNRTLTQQEITRHSERRYP